MRNGKKFTDYQNSYFMTLFLSLLLIPLSGGLDANVNFMSFGGLKDKYD